MIYKTVHNYQWIDHRSWHIIALWILHSSAVVDIESETNKGKETAATPFRIPPTPFGAKETSFQALQRKHLQL